MPVTTTSGEPSDERTQLFDLMGDLKLYGMKAAFDEIMATAVKGRSFRQDLATSVSCYGLPVLGCSYSMNPSMVWTVRCVSLF